MNLSLRICALFVLVSNVISQDEATSPTTEQLVESSEVQGIDVRKAFVRLNDLLEEFTAKLARKPVSKAERLERIFNEILDNSTTLKFRPDVYGKPTPVLTNVEIRELLEISEVDMQIKLNLEMNVLWRDPRLGLPEDEEIEFPPGGVWVHNSVKEKIWIPKVSILNEKESVSHSAGFVQEAIKWDEYGIMLWRINLAATIACSMSLENFPMDEQNCSILVGSPNYNDEEIRLTVITSLHPVFSSSVKNVELLGVRITPLTHEDLEFDRTFYSYELLLKRHVGYYIIGTFFPSALVVLISWLTFWMARDAAGERMALGVTCVLTITTLLISSQASSPKVSYIKAIDIYMGVCFALVFTTLLQSTALGYLLRKVRVQGFARTLEGRENAEISPTARARGFASIVRRVMSGGLETDDKPKVAKFVLRCDLWCRGIYPLIFFVFNSVYWTYYSSGSRFHTENGWTEPQTSTDVTFGSPLDTNNVSYLGALV